MKRVATAVVLIPLVLAIVLWDSLPTFTVAVGVVAVLCLVEYQRLISSLAGSIPKRTALVIVVSFFCLLTVSFHVYHPNPKLDLRFLDLVFLGAAFAIVAPGILTTAMMT